MEPDIPVPGRDHDRGIRDPVHERRVHAFERDQEIGCLREGVAVHHVTDV